MAGWGGSTAGSHAPHDCCGCGGGCEPIGCCCGKPSSTACGAATGSSSAARAKVNRASISLHRSVARHIQRRGRRRCSACALPWRNLANSARFGLPLLGRWAVRQELKRTTRASHTYYASNTRSSVHCRRVPLVSHFVYQLAAEYSLAQAWERGVSIVKLSPNHFPRSPRLDRPETHEGISS